MAEWTPKRVAILEQMWAEGHSASQIAKRLGEVTRSSVIGKVHRRGLLRGKTVRAIKPKERLRTGSADMKRLKVLAKQMNAVDAADPVDAGVRLIDLSDNQCRFPVNDAKRPEDHRFCGAKCDGTYCEEHHRIAYQPRSGKPQHFRLIDRRAA